MIIDANRSLENRNLYSFFYNVVSAVNYNNRHLQLNNNAVTYLISILSTNPSAFSSASNSKLDIKSETPDSSNELSTASLHKILRNSGISKLNGLKSFGDKTLLRSGFFYKSVSTNILSHSYYETLGKEAYGHLGLLSKNEFKNIKHSPSELFDFLSYNYAEIALFLSDVSDLVFFVAGLLDKEEAKIEKLSKNFDIYQNILRNEPKNGIIIVKA